MTNAERFHFADFTRLNYRQLLCLAKSNFVFRNYDNYKPDEKFVVWRHDVDYSMHSAKKLALIEAEEGVSATYMLLMHSEFYNLFEKSISGLVHDIISLGHKIGLHFDAGYYNLNDEKTLNKKLEFEKSILEEVFDIEINVFSFHNPTSAILEFNNQSYANMINCYAEKFRNEIRYCSDSNGYWRYDRLEDVLLENDSRGLQVLTHPEWWQDEPMSPRQRAYRCIDGRAYNLKSQYDIFLAQNQRLNVDIEVVK